MALNKQILFPIELLYLSWGRWKKLSDEGSRNEILKIVATKMESDFFNRVLPQGYKPHR